MASAWYCTREEVKEALDFQDGKTSNRKVDRACDMAARAVEAFCHRTFYPQIDTRYFDWPNYQYANSWRLWLDANEVLEVTALTAGGTVISADDYFLEPNTYGPPYSRIEINLGSSASFSSGDTAQRSVEVEGVFGYTNETNNVTTLAASGADDSTSLTVASSNNIGVGSILKIEDEWIIVTEKRMTSTGQTLQTPLTAAKNDVVVSVSDGSVFSEGDVLLLDAERVKVTEIADDSLIVVRAWDGTVLAAHTGSTVNAPNSLVVQRGVFGSTAASHASAEAVAVLVLPGLVRQLAVAEAVNTLLQESSGYARSEGQESNNPADIGRGLQGLRDLVKRQYSRKARIRGV